MKTHQLTTPHASNALAQQHDDENTSVMPSLALLRQPTANSAQSEQMVRQLQHIHGNGKVGLMIARLPGRRSRPGVNRVAEEQATNQLGICPVCGRVGRGRCSDCGQPFVARQVSNNLSELQREPEKGGFEGDQVRQIREAKTPGDVKDINKHAFYLADDNDRLRLINILLDQTWVGPRDEFALEHIWNSFGKNLVQAASSNLKLWKDSIDRGAALYELSNFLPVKLKFKADIVARARHYLDENLQLAQSEMERLGLNAPDAPPSPEQKSALEIERQAAKQLARARQAQQRMLDEIYVGYANRQSVPNAPPEYKPASFNPQRPPERRPRGDERPPMAEYEVVQTEYNNLDAFVNGISERHPMIYALLRDGKLDEVAGANQNEQRKTMATSLQGLISNINKTFGYLDPNSDFAFELLPIHRQLLKDDPAWQPDILKTVAQKAVEDYDNSQFWKTIGIGTFQLALFVVAEMSTGGLATFFFAAGAVSSGVQAAESWQKYDTAKTTAGTNLNSATALMTQQQVDTQLVAAVLDTAFALLDVYGAAKSAAGAVRGANAESKLLEAQQREARLVGQEIESQEKLTYKFQDEFRGEPHELKVMPDGSVVRCSPDCDIVIRNMQRRTQAMPGVKDGKNAAAVQQSQQILKQAEDLSSQIKGLKAQSSTPNLSKIERDVLEQRMAKLEEKLAEQDRALQGLEREQFSRQALLDEGYALYGDTDAAIRARFEKGLNRKLTEDELKMADVIASQGDRWVVTESKGGLTTKATDQLTNAIDLLMKAEKVDAALIEARITVKPEQYARLAAGEAVQGYKMRVGYLVRFDEAANKTIPETINGIPVKVQTFK